ncbi:MAG TPA: PqqD family protein [Ignavibacteriaceae bacterium]
MPFSLGKKKSNPPNILELTPFRIYSHETADNGNVSVLIPRFHNRFLAKMLNSRLRDPYVRVKFDEFGSSAWLEIDGQKNVYAITRVLLEKHGEKIQPVIERVSKFLNQLYIYKFINFNEMKGEE